MPSLRMDSISHLPTRPRVTISTSANTSSPSLSPSLHPSLTPSPSPSPPPSNPPSGVLSPSLLSPPSSNIFNFSSSIFSSSSHQTSSSSYSSFRSESADIRSELWEIERTEIIIGDQFAGGSFGRLSKGVYRGQDVAVKTLTDDLSSSGDDTEATKTFLKEVAMLSQLNHPNVLKFVGASSFPPFLVVTEYLPYGDLRSFLQKQTSPLDIATAIAIGLDIARGMEYLHSKGVVHRDLKPDNIVCSASRSWTICDFGIARTEGLPQDMTAEMGTCRWMAPEVIMCKPYNRKVDVYSFGLLMWQLLSGEVPFREMTAVQVAFGVANKNIRPTIPKRCPADFLNLIQACWHQSASRRPEFSKIVRELESMASLTTPRYFEEEKKKMGKKSASFKFGFFKSFRRSRSKV